MLSLTNMQTIQLRVRLESDNAEVIKRLALDSGLQQIDMASMLLHSAVQAVVSAKGRIRFPLRFVVCDVDPCPAKPAGEDPPALNDPRHKCTAKK